MTPILELRGLTTGYVGVPVVRDLDLTVAPGEVVALLGANGAGKTTTLRAVAGLLAPISGEVRFDGRSVSGVAAHKRARQGIAYVPEDRALFRSLTVRENVRLGRQCAIEDVTARFPTLDGLLDRRVGLLSGGEQQMLAVGRALAGQVRLLMIDEMSLGLAPLIVQALLPAVREAAEARGVGVLIVEQHVHLALSVVDRAYVLSHGNVVIAGAADDLAKDPDLLASSYLGDVAIAG